jgi:nucleotide-binding universal stress UspA family protein
MALTVVVGYDGSPGARQAIREAARIATRGRLVVVYAREQAPPHITSRWRRLLEQEHVEHGQAILESAIRDAGVDLSDVRVEPRLATGRPAPAFMAVAHEVGADMVIVGSHGFAAVDDLLGSVARALVGKSDLPVLIIPPRCADRVTGEELLARSW